MLSDKDKCLIAQLEAVDKRIQSAIGAVSRAKEITVEQDEWHILSLSETAWTLNSERESIRSMIAMIRREAGDMPPD